MEKIKFVLSRTFSVILGLCMITALLVAAAFIIALCVGGNLAGKICSVISAYVLPVVYVSGATAAFIGIVQMYLSGKKSFMLQSSKKK